MMLKALQMLLLLCLVTGQVLAATEAKETTDTSVTKTLLWPDGTRYVGGVKDGKRSGKGTIFWQDGTRFVGTFVNDKRNGPGTMILPDGTVYNAYFQDDTLVKRSESVAQSEPSAPVADITAADLPPNNTIATAPPTQTEQQSIVPAASNDSGQTAATIDTPKPSAGTANDTEAATDTTAVAEARLTPDMRKQIQAAIDLWAEAWSNQDVAQYLDAYAANFDVPGRQSRRQWEGLRRSRLTRPSRIEVKLSYDTFELIAPNRVQVDFNQVYDSNLYSDKTNKRLIMEKQADRWQIVSEQSR